MVNQEAVERLRTLGVFPKDVEENASILGKYKDVSSIGEECARRDIALSGRQFVYFHVDALLKKDPDYRADFLGGAKEQLKDFGVKPEHIEEYFQLGTEGHILFCAEHKEYKDIPDSFFDRADQLALNGVKQWLGFE